ncbi:hypothetical protein Amet_1209 [Alkaliphilus metalliredigens QYMF]|uniref:Uncharacterized protein n=1 Tax=Alkaliphilus metalliredigens (strain QYMF) TaxID=293826 RepID=A6TMJ9_ALKMQ|nr:hypothetical protein [Alkaliphilus metalliredigens]ABR47417.1 hypothetical protein Amet_1209 [Alkaliphilus metalliredigens QYMF]
MNRYNILRQIKLAFKLSMGTILLASIVGLVTGYLRSDSDLLKTIFNTNYIVGALLITFGVFSLFSPINLRKTTRLVDYSNVTDVLKDVKETKDEMGLDHIYWGITHLLLISLIELALFYIL